MFQNELLFVGVFVMLLVLLISKRGKIQLLAISGAVECDSTHHSGPYRKKPHSVEALVQDAIPRRFFILTDLPHEERAEHQGQAHRQQHHHNCTRSR